MTTRHLAILVAVILGTCGLVAVLPSQLGYQPVGAVLQLPEYLGEWWGKNAQVTPEERSVLGADTDFARKNYQNGSEDLIYTSIVLSGQDMMTSIHRPERCLQGQGWNTGASSLETIDVPGFGRLKATRLQTSRKDMRPGPNGEPASGAIIHSVSYYWFIGYTAIASSHEQRVALDFKDRIVHGYNQRWAMVMLTSEITQGLRRFGRNEKQTDELVVNFIRQLVPVITGASVQHTAALDPGQWVAQREDGGRDADRPRNYVPPVTV